MALTAVYPGTFDPITRGHSDLIERGSGLFERLVVAVAENPKKSPLFSFDERVEMVREVTGHLPNVEVMAFSGLLTRFVEEIDGNVILRGLRAISDFEYEFQMASMNRKQPSHVETVFLMTGESYTYLSSRFVKEIGRMGGEIDFYVHPEVARRLLAKLGEGQA
ncbi:MAG: pantetheine-phosphate adenylyltransferase [Alphaproteobacteria bacterium CG_4_10_14_0_2_um_filter_63_37]|nr:MAG: pantetheine-phosphate adenylyltransferase [Proteobacteria bacterium CG1_02_64_396]PJA23902.1 MAG: pantetheine-phosphate adenylyltransferase [Alphaproteobacteria bacterium CG_4_10_14_0_2_um_filter_63_37]